MPRPLSTSITEEDLAKIPIVVCQKLDFSSFYQVSSESEEIPSSANKNSIVEIPDNVYEEFLRAGKLHENGNEDQNSRDDYRGRVIEISDDESSEDECYSWENLSVRDKLYADAKIVLLDCAQPRENRRLRRFGYKFSLKGKRKYVNHPLVDYYQSLNKVIIREKPTEITVPEKCVSYIDIPDNEIKEEPVENVVPCNDSSLDNLEEKFDDSSKENSPPQHIVSMSEEELLSGELHLSIPSLDDLDDPCLVDKVPLDEAKKEAEPSSTPQICPPEELLRDVENVLSEYLDNLGEANMFKCCCVTMKHNFDNVSKNSPWLPQFITSGKSSPKRKTVETEIKKSEQNYKSHHLNDVLEMKVDSKLSNNRSLPRSVNFRSNKLKNQSTKRMKSSKITNHKHCEWKSKKKHPNHHHHRRLRSKHR